MRSNRKVSGNIRLSLGSQRRTCGAMEVHYRLLERYPEFRKKEGDIERSTMMRLAGAKAFRAAKGPIKIPVVVHVVYHVAAENISKAQIDSQIEALNRDYSAKNSDKSKTPICWIGLVTDMAIQFALATNDPSGNATDGVIRKKTQRKSFDSDDSVKRSTSGGADPWPSNRYLNIWVCSLDGLLGYAQFPGGPAETDGVVILNSAFGTIGTAAPPFNLGRTTTHEIGHWLNLRHIWGDTADCTGDDFVDDTPKQQHPNYGKPTFPHVSCNNGPNGDMFMNYMDYVDDDTMVMFTAGQGVRVHSALYEARRKFLANGQGSTT